MQQGRARTVVEPFFLSVGTGRRFCIFRAPPEGVACKAAVLHVPAFGEEMNKARRMVALQARRLAEHGIASLQIDLFGTGDSDGDFRDARWEHWITDVVAGCKWLERRSGGPVGLWTLRLGALLAAEILRDGLVDATSLVLWQPVVSGQTFLTQFLRLRVASAIIQGKSEGLDTRQMRAALRNGESVEIAGYELTPGFADALDSLRLSDLVPQQRIPCTWMEVATTADGGPSPAIRKVIDAWAGRKIEVDLRCVQGEPFWATVEIAENASLLDETLTAIVGRT